MKPLACLLFILCSGLSAQTKEGLTIIITGFENDNGLVMVALSDSKKDYEKRGTAFRGGSFKIENGQAICAFENTPLGEYSFKYYHDKNGNGKLDTSILGWPVEDYGFSNNAKGFFGIPPYEKAKFDFSQNSAAIHVHIN